MRVLIYLCLSGGPLWAGVEGPSTRSARSGEKQMNTRQEQLLKYVIDSHIETGEPVGSTRLVEGYRLDISPATVRHDLLALEEEGFLMHPHTSAGRIPTAAGYRYYVNHLQSLPALSRDERVSLERARSQREEARLKELARTLALLTNETVIVAIGRNSLYYTGVKNLFTKPEFSAAPQVVALSELLDDMDACFDRLWNDITDEVTTRIGMEGAFGTECSTISIRMSPDTAYVLLGPLRMRYDHNMALLKEIQKLF